MVLRADWAIEDCRRELAKLYAQIAKLPRKNREAAQVAVRRLHGSLDDLATIARERAGRDGVLQFNTTGPPW